MAQVTFNIPDDQAARVGNAVAGTYGWTGTHNGAAETKAQFLKRQLVLFLKNVVKAYEAQAASETARKAAYDAAESEITIT